jgi:hypothetical protein
MQFSHATNLSWHRCKAIPIKSGRDSIRQDGNWSRPAKKATSTENLKKISSAITLARIQVYDE